MSAPRNAANLGTANSNMHTAKSLPSLVCGLDPSYNAISSQHTTESAPTMPARHEFS